MCSKSNFYIKNQNFKESLTHLVKYQSSIDKSNQFQKSKEFQSTEQIVWMEI